MNTAVGLAIEASIDGVLPPAEHPNLAAALAALWEAADREVIWIASYPATEEVLTSAAWRATIEAVVCRDGRWTAPLLLGHSCREVTMRLRLVHGDGES